MQEKMWAANEEDFEAVRTTSVQEFLSIDFQRLKKPTKRKEFELPDWVPKEAWDGFIEMRLKVKAPLTIRAMNLKIEKLKQFKEKGMDPGMILDKSTENAWLDIYEIKQGNPKPYNPWDGAR